MSAILNSNSASAFRSWKAPRATAAGQSRSSRRKWRAISSAFAFFAKPGDNVTRHQFTGTVKGNAIEGTVSVGDGATLAAIAVERDGRATRRGPAMTAPAQDAQPRPSLSLGDAVAMIVGLIVGVGIFGTPSIVAGNSGSPAIVRWACGWRAACFRSSARCATPNWRTAFPTAGGEYHFLRRAFGHSLSFLFAWARMTVIVAGSIAVFAYLFGDYMSRIVNLGAHSSAIWAALVVGGLTLINYAGIREAKVTQNLFTVLEVGGLVLIVVTGLVLAPVRLPAAAAVAGAGQPWYMGAGIGSAMVFVLFTYGGWNDAAYISAEVRDREHNMVRALLFSIGIVTVLYVLVNVAYLKGLGYTAMARSDAVAADLLKNVLGTTGEKLISFMIAVAAFTSVNGSIIVGARSNYALGRDWPLFELPRAAGTRRAARRATRCSCRASLRSRWSRSARFTTRASRGWSSIRCRYSGDFSCSSASRCSSCARKSRMHRGHSGCQVYPVVPAIFVLTCAYLLYSSLAYHGKHALVGLAVLAVGAIVMLVCARGEGGKPA